MTFSATRGGRVVCVALLAASLVVHLPAVAADPPQEPAAPEPQTSNEAKTDEARKVAREKGTTALQLFRMGRYEEAYALFREADDLFHTLPLVLYMARCQDKRGQLLEARALYERVFREPAITAEPEPIVKARQAAMAEVGPLKLRIPTLAIDVRGPPPDQITLFVDGAVWPVGEPRELDPGSHEVEAITRSGARTGRTLDVPEGRTMSILLRLGLFAPASRTTTLEVPSDPQRRPAAAAAAFGVGASALGIGAVTGFVVLGRSGILRQRCEAGCSPLARAELNETRALGHVSTASFVLGGAGLLAGVVLVATLPPEKPSRIRFASELWFRLGPGSIVAEGRF
jgi:hypothetical protein